MMNVYLRADDQPGDKRASDATGSGRPPWCWWRWKRPNTLLTSVASAALVSFSLTPAGPSTMIAAGRLFGTPGCADPQSLVQVPASTISAASRGTRYFEWTFLRAYDIRLVCLAGDPPGPGGADAGTPSAVTAMISGQCPDRTASLQGYVGADAYRWLGTPIRCVTDHVVLRVSAAPGQPAPDSPGRRIPRARFYYCPAARWPPVAR
jgi:hypothetical protein